jgi:hypothetical protein
MKHHWETEELVDYWTLLPPELESVSNKTKPCRSGFAVLLKYFALEGRFPGGVSEIPPAAIEFVAKQVRVAPELISKYRLDERTAAYHRTQIRGLFNFREATTDDAIKRMNDGEYGISYKDLLYVRRRYLHKEQLREAIRTIVGATFQARNQSLWGEGTTACASDSKKFGASKIF